MTKKLKPTEKEKNRQAVLDRKAELERNRQKLKKDREQNQQKVQCPHCNEIYYLPIAEILKNLNTPQGNLDHRHKTADEFLDCPECRLWVDKTALRYQVSEKAPQDKEPEPVLATKPALGSIFRKEGEHE